MPDQSLRVCPLCPKRFRLPLGFVDDKIGCPGCLRVVDIASLLPFRRCDMIESEREGHGRPQERTGRIEPLAPPTETREFAIKEYEALRKEISDSVAETRSVERYAVVATAAIWTWLLVEKSGKPWVETVKWIPVVFSLLAAIRCAALLLGIANHAEYIREVEERWGAARGFRWEHFILNKPFYITYSSIFIFSVLVFGNFLLAIFIHVL